MEKMKHVQIFHKRLVPDGKKGVKFVDVIHTIPLGEKTLFEFKFFRWHIRVSNVIYI